MSRPARLIPFLVAATAITACGATAGSSPHTTTATAPAAAAVDHLAGKPAATIVKDAQSWLRTGHYHFRDSTDLTTVASHVTGVPQQILPALTGSISLTGEGDVDGDKHISAAATVVGVAQTIHLVEDGCLGYASMDGTSWFTGSRPRWLTRMVAPGFDDGLTTLAWHDLGSTTRDGVAVHHLQATLTALGLSGGAPPPGATPPPGFDVQPTPMDLWVRSSDGSLLEMDGDAVTTTDLRALAASGAAPALRNAAGTLHVTMRQTAAFSTLRGTVQAPDASLGSDPVPARVYDGFGGFGVETDSCGAGA